MRTGVKFGLRDGLLRAFGLKVNRATIMLNYMMILQFKAAYTVERALCI